MKHITRRHLLETAALGGAAVATAAGAETTGISDKGMPTRVLGKTGARVPILAMGGGSRFLSYENEETAIAAMNKAIDSGITYIDTAFAYGGGQSETRVGKIMATRRKEVFLATKVSDRNGDKAMRTIEGSLKRLQTDQIDLLHIHSLTSPEDLAAIEAKGGVLQTLYKVREQKMARFISITCHTDPTVLKAALEHNDFDCVQMALNAALVGMKGATGGMVIAPEMKESFETVAMPVAVAKKMGIIAMKIYAADGLVGQAPARKLLSYSLSLPVSLAVVGMPKVEHIDDNVKIAKSFKALPRAEMKELSAALSSKNKLALDLYLHRHVDEYAAD